MEKKAGLCQANIVFLVSVAMMCSRSNWSPTRYQKLIGCSGSASGISGLYPGEKGTEKRRLIMMMMKERLDYTSVTLGSFRLIYSEECALCRILISLPGLILVDGECMALLCHGAVTVVRRGLSVRANRQFCRISHSPGTAQQTSDGAKGDQ